MVQNNEWGTKNGYPEPEIVDWEAKSDQHFHGEDGHTGYRCGQCAREAVEQVASTDYSVDYWQTKQIQWQEDCDVIMADFDRRVAQHFPKHKAVKCKTCPKTSPLPEQPNPPIERSMGQVDESTDHLD